MAVVYTSAAGVTRQACDSTAGELLKVTLPSGTNAVMLRPIAAAGKVTHTGTDGAAIGSDYATLDADAWTVIPLSRAAFGSPPAFYIAHVNNNGVIEVLPVAT
jgi:hypothetical protein